MSFDPITYALCKGGGSGGGLPVIDLTTTIAQDGETNLSEEDCQKLTPVAEAGNVCALRFSFGGVVFSGIPTYMYNEGLHVYTIATPVGITVTFFGSNGVWVSQASGVG